MNAHVTEPGRAALSPADIRGIFVGIMLAMLLSALDQTIVATAMPTIGRELGEPEHLSWVVTAYLLASTAVTPLYGKFSDMHGRRVTLLIGIAVFILGSIACALSTSMLALIISRAVQGLGGGGLFAVSQTIVADMVTPRERGRYQVYFGAVFATSSLAGPVLGGFFAESLHWSMIFWINLPLGALALWLTNDRLKKLPRHDRPHRLDVLGAALMSAATVSLMLALSWGGVRYPWASAPIAIVLGFSLLLWLAFLVRLRTATEPLIPLTVLADGVVRTTVAASALGMGSFIGLSIFVPIYFEAALGFSAKSSGVALIPLMVGMVTGATVSGRAMARFQHYKRLPIAGLVVSTASLATLASVANALPFAVVEILLFLASLGLGTVMPVSTVSMQNAVGTHHLGTATATMNFCRQLAGAVVVAVYGALALSGSESGALTPETLARGVNAALADSFRSIFAAAAVALALCTYLFIRLEERPLSESPAAPAGGSEP